METFTLSRNWKARMVVRYNMIAYISFRQDHTLVPLFEVTGTGIVRCRRFCDGSC